MSQVPSFGAPGSLIFVVVASLLFLVTLYQPKPKLGVIHGFWNFFVINFDRLHFSKHTDQCVRINPPKDF